MRQKKIFLLFITLLLESISLNAYSATSSWNLENNARFPISISYYPAIIGQTKTAICDSNFVQINKIIVYPGNTASLTVDSSVNKICIFQTMTDPIYASMWDNTNQSLIFPSTTPTVSLVSVESKSKI